MHPIHAIWFQCNVTIQCIGCNQEEQHGKRLKDDKVIAEFIELYTNCKTKKKVVYINKRIEEFSRNRPEYEIYETKPTNFPLSLPPEENIGNIGNKKITMVFFKREANKCQVL